MSAHEIRFRELEQSLATISAREGQVRTALVEAHDQLLRRDEQLRETNTALDQLTSELERLTSAHDVLREERDRLADENHDFWRSQNEAREIIRSKDLEIAQLIVRLERVVNSRPVQVWLRFGRLPLVRSIFARRGARDSAELGQGARADR